MALRLREVPTFTSAREAVRWDNYWTAKAVSTLCPHDHAACVALRKREILHRCDAPCCAGRRA